MFERAGDLEVDYRGVDWASTGLGDPTTWDATLRQALDLAWHTGYPTALFWGPEHVLLYNRAYVLLVGDKHPSGLGRPLQEVFPEAWDLISARLEAALSGQGTTYCEDELVPLVRAGFLEDCYFTYSHSAVHGPDGRPHGVINIVSETTRQVIDRRRLELLTRLQALLGASDDRAAMPRLLAGLAELDHPDLLEVEYRESATVPAEDAVSHTVLPRSPGQPLPEGDLVLEETARGRVAWLPLRSSGADPADPPVLVVALSDRLPAGPEYLNFLSLMAAVVRQAMDRLQLLESERRVVRTERDLSEALQRSLLTAPAQRPGLQVAVRYLPAAHEVQIGGDWYDAFVVRDGSLTLTVGDVTGHDREAAASMAQVRNLMRAIAYTLAEPPSRIMTALDEAISGLDVDTTATALLAKVDPVADEPSGDQVLRWTVAGHLPPVLVAPSGEVRFLHAPPDPLLGVVPESVRHDHEVALEPGSSVLFFTDGLIERRHASLKAGMDWLAEHLAGRVGLDAEQLADHVMSDLAPDLEDDIAVLVLHVGH